MGRTRQAFKIDTPNARRGLPPRKAPYCVTLHKGHYLGYRKPSSGQAGTWIARYYNPETQKVTDHAVGLADDFQAADGALVLDWKQAQEKARPWFDLMHHQSTGQVIRRGSLTMQEAWEAYHADAKRRGVKTLQDMESMYRHHIQPFLGDAVVDRLTTARLQRWQAERAVAPYVPRARKRPRKLKPGELPPEPRFPVTEDELRARKLSTNNMLRLLHAILNHAREKKLTHAPAEVWMDVRRFEGVDEGRTIFLSEEEQVRLVNGADADFAQVIRGGLFTGCRHGELRLMWVKDFGPLAGQGQGAVWIPGEHTKTGKPRWVYLTKEGKAFFQALTAGRNPEEPMFLRAGYLKKGGAGGASGPQVMRCWHEGEQWYFMQEALERAQLPHMTFHELRHTYASGLVNAGIALAFVARQLGHTTTKEVERRYGHLAPSAIVEAIDRHAPQPGIFTPENVQPLRPLGSVVVA